MNDNKEIILALGVPQIQREPQVALRVGRPQMQREPQVALAVGRPQIQRPVEIPSKQRKTTPEEEKMFLLNELAHKLGADNFATLSPRQKALVIQHINGTGEGFEED